MRDPVDLAQKVIGFIEAHTAKSGVFVFTDMFIEYTFELQQLCAEVTQAAAVVLPQLLFLNALAAA